MDCLNPKAITDEASVLRIVARDQHLISRKNISRAALDVLYRLHRSGYEAFLVGGAVRDLQLGGRPKDFDVATNATPEEIQRLFSNCRLIGRRFRLAHVLFGSEIVEVATFRGTTRDQSGGADGHGRKIVDGRIVRDNVWGKIEEDALRRDFRVNAMYYDISDFSVRDYTGGIQDLGDRVLRLIGDPVTRYREDPVRMLRAVRLAAKLNFQIDETATRPFAELGYLLTGAEPARLFDESLKMFLGGHGLKSFQLLERYQLLAFLFPLTTPALKRGDAALRAMIEQGLANTDARVADGKPVTPAFLFAMLLWREVSDRVQAWIARGIKSTEAWNCAVHQVVGAQCQRVAIPRRFTDNMKQIWWLQPCFEQFQRESVLRLLAHPRFRAAFDFLLLRGDESPVMPELGRWWTHAQQLPTDMLAAALSQHGDNSIQVPPEEVTTRPPLRRRRRHTAMTK